MQNVDIPVRHRVFYGDLQGFHTGQGSTAQNVDIPVLHRVFYGDLHGFRTGQDSTAQNVDIPVPHRVFYGDLQGFRTGQGSTAQNVDIPVCGGVPEDTHVPGSIEWVQLSDGDTSKTYYWNRRTRDAVRGEGLGIPSLLLERHSSSPLSLAVCSVSR